jgi:hypothetical protein
MRTIIFTGLLALAHIACLSPKDDAHVAQHQRDMSLGRTAVTAEHRS